MNLSLSLNGINHADNLFVFNIYMVLLWIVTHLGALHIFLNVNRSPKLKNM